MGMWIFLLTELLLFTGLFLVYAVYRYYYTKEFHEAGMQTHILFGTVNTMVLLTSSLTMVLSIAAIQRGKKWLSATFLSSTILLGLAFLIIKYVEWSEEIAKGIYPGSPTLLAKSNGEVLFFGLYYTMTGLHAIHVIAGMTILIFMLVFILRNKITKDNYTKLENAGLYWHLVDIIWIFLFPLFYLIN
ncbi:MAG: cytochrome c oxidase subunit 3 [Bacteroidetes bacterium]|nr:cytochrome c oxidase subunit 3 [Bacteroidota bacterium]